MSSPYHIKIELDADGEADFYAIARALQAKFGAIDPALAHAQKKVLYAGCRGHKDLLKDLGEAIWSLGEYKKYLDSKA